MFISLIMARLFKIKTKTNFNIESVYFELGSSLYSLTLFTKEKSVNGKAC